MIETLVDIIGHIAGAADALRFILPQAGVGGGIDVKESVDLVPLLKFTLIFVGSIAALFGLGLAFAAQKFSVKVDPRVEQVSEVLAHAHCGACGFPGCAQYAEAVVGDPNVSPSLCTPGGAKTALAVARITGKAADAREPVFSRIMCQGGEKEAVRKFKYEGVADCRAAVLAGGGDKGCAYGCLGYGTCMRVCPFGAIKMSTDMLPIVDMKKCTGCRKCEAACPKRVIEIVPGGKAVLVSCHSRDKGAQTRKLCETGCIACGMCVRVCPYDAPSISNNLSRIDIGKCKVCGLCVRACPTNAIRDYISFRSKAFITDACIGCGKCAKVCPVNAPSGEKKKKHSIDQGKCIGCGICTANCPVQAIDGTINAQEVFAEAARKKAEKKAMAPEPVAEA